MAEDRLPNHFPLRYFRDREAKMERSSKTMTSKDELRTRIQEVFSEVYAGQNEEMFTPALKDTTVLLETGLDSLGFAILVTRLEEELGYDPFSLSSEAYYPQTFGEFVDFYHKNSPI